MHLEQISSQITPGTTLNIPKCNFLGWQIASGTVFVISATRPRGEWFPSRTMPLRAGDSSPCCATNARCAWKVKMSHVCSKETENQVFGFFGGYAKLHLEPPSMHFWGLTNCIWHRPRNVRRRKLIEKSKGKDEVC